MYGQPRGLRSVSNSPRSQLKINRSSIYVKSHATSPLKTGYSLNMKLVAIKVTVPRVEVHVRDTFAFLL